MKQFLLLILVMCAPLVGFSSEPAALFDQAKTVAKSEPLKARKLFQLAGLQFEALAQEQPELRAKALFNAGNAHFYAEEPGRALFAYRRAEQVMPFSAELKENISYLTELHSEETVVAAKMNLLQKVHAVFPQRVRITLSMLFYLGAVGVAAVWQWRAKTHRVTLAIFGGLAALFAVSVVITVIGGPKNGVVLSYQSDARKGDGYIYESAFAQPMTEATEFRVSKVRGDWVLATLADGNQGWLPRSEVGLW